MERSEVGISPPPPPPPPLLVEVAEGITVKEIDGVGVGMKDGGRSEGEGVVQVGDGVGA